MSSSHRSITTRTLIWRRFRRNRVAIASAIVLVLVYLPCLLAEYFAPYSQEDSTLHVFAPPTRIHFVDETGRLSFHPFVYGLRKQVDLESLTTKYVEDQSEKYFLHWFVMRPRSHAGPGSLQNRLRLYGVDEGGVIFLLGADYRGRDLLTQILYGGRVTISVGIFGVFVSTVIGIILGTISGYFSGVTDILIQRVIEILSSIPRIPLWMAMAAIIPPKWPPVYVYWGIVTVLGLLGWTGMARQIRAKVLNVKEKDFIMASRAGGASHRHMMFRHVVPNVMSHIIVVTTLALPGLILAESSLSFLGLGIRPPMTSWGLLLQNAQNLFAVKMAPWIMTPGLFIVVTVLCFNFLGDGIRDAVDPYN